MTDEEPFFPPIQLGSKMTNEEALAVAAEATIDKSDLNGRGVDPL